MILIIPKPVSMIRIARMVPGNAHIVAKRNLFNNFFIVVSVVLKYCCDALINRLRKY